MAKKQNKPTKSTAPKLIQEESLKVALAEAAKQLKASEVERGSLVKSLELIKGHLTQCNSQTGKIYPEDVDYCIKLAKRVAEYAKETYLKTADN